MGDGIDCIKHTEEIQSSDDVKVILEGENEELIKYLKTYIITIMKSYHYNGIPKDMEHALKHNKIRTTITGFKINGKEKPL